MGVPVHGNLGDQAIIFAENKLFNELFPKYKVIEIESSIIRYFSNVIRKVVGKSDIYVHGGGFLGNLWINEEIMFRSIIKMFPENRIIVLPQTIFFTNDNEGKKQYEISKEIYESHAKITFILREHYSYDYMKLNFPNCNIKLAPDMVLLLDNNDFQRKSNYDKEKVLFCVRNDKEKNVNDYSDIIESLKKCGINNIQYTDTVISKNIYKRKRKRELSKKINEFSDAKLIVTDRLHGMIFSLIAGTPCLVFQNKSYKIKGVYDWIKDIDYIILHDENKSYSSEIEKLLNSKIVYNNDEIKTILKEMI